MEPLKLPIYSLEDQKLLRDRRAVRNYLQWLKTYPVVLELYGNLPESYLRLMHYQDLNRGNQQ